MQVSFQPNHFKINRVTPFTVHMDVVSTLETSQINVVVSHSRRVGLACDTDLSPHEFLLFGICNKQVLEDRKNQTGVYASVNQRTITNKSRSLEVIQD